jgi:tetratricopeptide (TPR) repeat protein
MSAKLPQSLIGRGEVLSEFRRVLHTPGLPGVSLMLLTGEEGVGKTTLLRVAARDAREHGFAVVEGRALAVDMPRPFYLLRELFDSLTAQRERKSAPRDELRSLVGLGVSHPRGRDTISLPMGLLPFGASLESPAEREKRLLAALSGGAANLNEAEQELFDRLADHIEEVTAGKKHLFAIDDFQYVDRSSMEFLGYLCRRTRGQGMKLIAACRPEAEIPEMVRAYLDEMGREGLLHRLEVRRLTEEESHEFLGLISRGQEILPEVAKGWVASSRGNPLSLVQLFRGGVASVGISRTGAPHTGTVLAKLSEDDLRILSHASILGKSFRFHSLFQAVGGDEERLTEIVDSLMRNGIVKDLGNETFEFTKEEIWKEIYDSMSDSRRRVLHRKAAEAYEKEFPTPTPDTILEIGHHFYMGRVHDRSLLYNRYAATIATNAFSPDVAIRYLERAREDLSALPGDHRLEEAEVLKEIGEQHTAMGDATRAYELFGESLEKLPEEEETMRALLLLSRANSAREMDQLELARQYCEEALRLLDKAGHKRGLALAHRILGRAAAREGQLEAARTELETTIALLDPDEDAKEVAGCYIDLGNTFSDVDDKAEQTSAISFYRKAIQNLEKLRDYRELARAHNNLALTLMPAHPQEALEEIRMARDYSEKAKDRRGLGWRLFNGVEIYIAVGDIEGATRDNEEAGKILSQLNDRIGIQQIVLNRGILAQYRKSYEEAEKEYLEALRQAEELGYAPKLVEAHIRIASLYADLGRREKVLEEISHIRKLGEDTGDLVLNAVYAEVKRRVGYRPG